MSTKLEIEKRFLIKVLPSLIGVKSKKTVDVYFPEVTEHAFLRARNQDGKYEMTKRSGKKPKQVCNG